MRKLIATFLLASLALVSHSLQANDLNLELYKGKVIYVDFWASWCGPCRQSFPWMKALQDAKSKEGLVILAINVDQEKKLANAFLEEFSPAFKIIFDPEGKLATEYKVAGMPSAFILDRTGNIRYKHIGFHNDRREQYEQEIQTLLNEK